MNKTSLRLLLLGLSLFVAGALLEVALRVGWPNDIDLYRPDTVLGWKHTPGARGFISVPGEFRTFIEINALGLRGKDAPYVPPPDTQRILVLGDSFVQAVQVRNEDTFSSQLEEMLASASAQVKVLNAGVGGYNTAQEYLSFREEGHKYQADLVLLTFLINNDTLGNYYDDETTIPRVRLRLSENGLKEERSSTDGGDSANQTVSFDSGGFHSIFLEQLRLRLKALPIVATVVGRTMAPKPPRMNDIFAPEYSDDTAAAWQLTEGILQALRSEVARLTPRAKLSVVIWPDHVQYDDVWWQRRLSAYPAMATYDRQKPERVLTEILDRIGIRYVSLTEALREETRRSNHHLFFQADGHPTAQGHRAAAAAIARFITNESLLDSGRLTRQ